MDNNQNISFVDLEQKTNIRIPAIQRDYAQGRKTPNVTKIRKKFVHSLALVVKGIRKKAMLDFVYGSERNDAFEPLDGQQRLTTLFLFHWILGTELFNEKRHSKFLYETRISTLDFCNMLVNVVAKDLIVEVINQNNRIEDIQNLLKASNDERKEQLELELKELTINETIDKVTPSVIIQSWSDFKYEWRFDPSIQSMLVMIDTIFLEMDFQVTAENDNEKGISNWEMYRCNLNHITFDILNIDDFGFSDELFVKMNARGKQLSEFDITKSSIESELQLLQKEFSSQSFQPLASKKDEVEWRTCMDGKWIDLFWNCFAVKEIEKDNTGEKEEDMNKRLFKAAENAENRFKLFILRMIGLQLLLNNPEEKVQEAAYNSGSDTIDDLLDAYQDSLVALRSQEDTNKVKIDKTRVIDFSNLIVSVNSVIYKDINDGTIKAITDLLPYAANANPDNRESTYFDFFTNDKVSNFNTVIWHAISLYCQQFKYVQTGECCYDEQNNRVWLSNLTEWVKFIRNIVLYDNVNDRIDTRKEVIEALKSVDRLFGVFKHTEGSVIYDTTMMIKFIAGLGELGTANVYPGLDNSAMEEEIDKAKLKLLDNGEEWVEWMAKAEEHSYLWGQIRCLLSWSQSDINKFKEYWNCLQKVLDSTAKNWQKLYVWLLKHSNYWENSNMLYEYNNKDRDLSFKRYFRTKQEDGFYASAIKVFLDEWKKAGCDLNEFLDNKMNDIMTDKKDWIWCMANYPEIINWSSRKKIFLSKGHYLLSKGKTMNTHCYDPVLLYLMLLYKSEKGDTNQFKLGDSQDKDEARQNTVEFIDKDGNTVFVGWGDGDGNYKVTIGLEGAGYSTNDMLEKVVPMIKGK